MRFRRHRSDSKAESERALEEARASLAEIKKRGEEVTQEANALRGKCHRNHFMEQFEELFVIKKVQNDDS